jgi:hypothetical protein
VEGIMYQPTCIVSASRVQGPAAASAAKKVDVNVAKSVRVEDEISRRGGLGLKRFGSELIGPCPQCGGRDRFGVSVAKQLWHCRSCNTGGDVIELVRHIDGCDFRTAIQTLTGSDRQTEVMYRVRHQAAVDLKPPRDDEQARIECALRIWREAQPIAGTLAENYLANRKLYDLPDASVIRFHGACPFEGAHHPCLIGLYRNIKTNRPQAIVRVALKPDGTKIKRAGLGLLRGTAIKLDPDEDVTKGLFVGEGLETCLAASQQYGFRPMWSLGSAGGIKEFEPLPGIESLTVLVDHDPPDKRGRCAGQAAATECWNRWTDAGREVRAFSTDELGTDIADIIETTGTHNAR